MRMSDYLFTFTARSNRFYNAADCKQHCILKSGKILIFVFLIWLARKKNQDFFSLYKCVLCFTPMTARLRQDAKSSSIYALTDQSGLENVCDRATMSV